MENPTHNVLLSFLTRAGSQFRVLEHGPCRTSEESANARASAGAAGTIGAKAIVVRVSGGLGYATIVVPGHARIDNKVVRKIIGNFSFANEDEIARVTGGLERGTIPPFAAPLFPAIDRLFVDESMRTTPMIGFNAAILTRSVVMSGAEYMKAVPNATEASLASSGASI